MVAGTVQYNKLNRCDYSRIVLLQKNLSLVFMNYIEQFQNILIEVKIFTKLFVDQINYKNFSINSCKKKILYINKKILL